MLYAHLYVHITTYLPTYFVTVIHMLCYFMLCAFKLLLLLLLHLPKTADRFEQSRGRIWG